MRAPRIGTALRMTEGVAGGDLFRLMAWLSPAYPIGAFSYSHGLEYAVEAGLIRDRAELVAWIGDILEQGGGHTDAVFLAETWRACSDPERLAEIADMAAVFRGTSELSLETMAQGRAFLVATLDAWPHPVLAEFAARHDGQAALPVAVGLTAACHGIALDAVLTAYLHAMAANLVSAGIRLIPLGQLDGQRAIAELGACVGSCVTRAMATSLETMGSATAMVDWTSLCHETQYTRLFRS